MSRAVRVTDVQEWLGAMAARYERQAAACHQQAHRHRLGGADAAAWRWTSRGRVLDDVARDLRDGITDMENLSSSALQS